LFVGHSDFKYLRYQFIDTPGFERKENEMRMFELREDYHFHKFIFFFSLINQPFSFNFRYFGSFFGGEEYN